MLGETSLQILQGHSKTGIVVPFLLGQHEPQCGRRVEYLTALNGANSTHMTVSFLLSLQNQSSTSQRQRYFLSLNKKEKTLRKVPTSAGTFRRVFSTHGVKRRLRLSCAAWTRPLNSAEP